MKYHKSKDYSSSIKRIKISPRRVKGRGIIYKYQCPYCETMYNSSFNFDYEVIICPQCGGPYHQKKVQSSGVVRYTTYSNFKKLKRIFTIRGK